MSLIKKLSPDGVQVRPPELDSPWLTRQGACELGWKRTRLLSPSQSDPQSNASHLLLMLLLLAHLQIAWIKHQNRVGGVLTASHCRLCYIPAPQLQCLLIQLHYCLPMLCPLKLLWILLSIYAYICTPVIWHQYCGLKEHIHIISNADLDLFDVMISRCSCFPGNSITLFLMAEK